MRFTNKTINEGLLDLRKGLRAGTVRVVNGDLRPLVAQELGIDKDAFNTKNFNPQTLKRFSHLFAAPLSVPPFGTIPPKYPSADDFAWAIQNFMNRRADPWAFRRPTVGEQFVTDATPSV